MSMESRSTKVSNVASLWMKQHNPVLATVKNNINYYEDPIDPHGPLLAVKGDELWLTTFYGLEDVELFG